MITELDNLPPDREWGILTREFSGKARGMALEVGILGRWLQKERIRTRLSLLYAGAEPDRYGREDRRLLWEDFMNREGLPDEATDAVLSIPSLDDTSEWLLISSPTINLDGIRPWRARTFQGLIDALRYGWAEIVSAAEFFQAEEYHRNYVNNHPFAPYSMVARSKVKKLGLDKD